MPRNKAKEPCGQIDDVDFDYFGEGDSKKTGHAIGFHINKSGLPLDSQSWERMWDHVSDVHPDGTRIQYSIRHKPCLREVSTLVMKSH